MQKATLLLEDGTQFDGKAMGHKGTTTGEICFNTSMTGYQEVFTDPSYHGQIIIHNNSHLGNYGISDFESESKGIKINGVICRNLSQHESRPMAKETIEEYLIANNIVGICDIDTRALVIHVRAKGAMNCVISTEDKNTKELKEILDQTPSMAGLELASEVSTKKVYPFGPENPSYKIAVIDLGIKNNILNNLKKRNIGGTVYPAQTSWKELNKENYDGFFLSNGPGDPASMPYAIDYATKMIDSGKPVFGICLGHQVLALASGLKTYKLHNGHRGTNHPVINLLTGKSEITSQNHGFGVDEKSILSSMPIEITHRNLNDQSIEGIRRTDKPVFSVQYHPEAAPGPHDSQYLFDNFLELLASS